MIGGFLLGFIEIGTYFMSRGAQPGMAPSAESYDHPHQHVPPPMAQYTQHVSSPPINTYQEEEDDDEYGDAIELGGVHDSYEVDFESREDVFESSSESNFQLEDDEA